MDKEQIQRELRNGVSIAEVCTRHNVSLLALFNELKAEQEYTYSPKARYSNTGELYIYRKSNGYYYLRKGGGHYGHYKSMSEAKKVRDYFIYNGWRKHRLDEVCKELGVEQVKSRGRY